MLLKSVIKIKGLLGKLAMDYSEFFNQRKIIIGCSTILPELSSAHAIKQYMKNILFELKQTSHKSAGDEKIRTLNEYLGRL